ncbi:MAG: alpha-2-macroglobulin family protein [Flavobacteriales bacterium]
MNNGGAPDPRWSAVDSLQRLGQFATALERTEALLNEARAAGDWRNEYRAWHYRSAFLPVIGRSNDSALLAMEARAAEAPVPLKQLLHAAVAEGWWQRYQSDRWRIMERTELGTPTADPETWTQRVFMEKVIAHYQASLEPADTLLQLPVGDLGSLLVSEGAAVDLRPTLYDVLAHRALEVFINSETRITEPAWRFKLEDAKDFGLFEPFALRTLQHRDSMAWEFQAMRIYQRLERAHLNDDKLDALVDVSFQRLAYVREHSVLAEKDSLYVDALNTLRSRVPDEASWAEVTYALASWHRDQGSGNTLHGDDGKKWENRTARTLCDEAIARFPDSFGAKRCAQLKAQLEYPALRIEVEDAVAPDRDFVIAAHYRNVRRIGVRVARLSADERYDRNELEKWLLGLKPVKEWSIELPDDGDLNEHLVELPVAGLPYGSYAIVAARDAAFKPVQGSLAYAFFTVTDLSVTQRTVDERTELVVLDRWMGTPRSAVKVVRWTFPQRWPTPDAPVRDGEASTDADGRVTFATKGEQLQTYYTLEHGADRFRTSANWAYGAERSEPVEEIRTFLFTDRAIYRPGQELYFKGIVVGQQQKAAAVKANHRTEVRFYDVNGQLIDSAQVTTDAFGAFQGKFTTPTGTLTGGMRLEEAHGSAYVQVEEYKRPTFELVFDPLAGAPKLGDAVTLTGTAKSYAGVPLDGATVHWNVDRGAHMPWWCWGWRGLPWGRSTEVASGTAVCDAQGRFTISFQAEADGAFPRQSEPTFHFTVSADATDISGETQSGTTRFSLAHRSIDIELGVGEALDRAQTDSLLVKVKNLNGEEMDVPMDVRIVELVPPVDAPRRERLWERPDRILEGELPTTHLADDPLSWPVNKVVFERKGHRAKGKALAVTGLEAFTVGSYRIEVEARDPQGAVVKVARLVTLYDTAIQNTGFVDEAFHVEAVKVRCEPGEKAALLLSSALPAGRVLMEVERDGRIAASRSFVLNKAQQLVELPVLESDRGGFAVHFLCVERGRSHQQTIWIDVPWTNKELQVEWMSFRDKLLPGAKEEWRLRITGPKKEKGAAQLLAVMYDASLDHFMPHDWSMFQWPIQGARSGWQQSEPFSVRQGNVWNMDIPLPPDTARLYPQLWMPAFMGRHYDGEYGSADMMLRTEIVSAAPPRSGARMDKVEGAGIMDANMAEEVAPPSMQPEDEPEQGGPQPVRTDFRETAFFLPDLLTDRDGSIVLRFTTPDALTRWKVMGLAHTKELEIARFTKQTTTSKPLMVVPNLPRFLRHGDRITLTAKINATEGPVQGNARLSLFDPVSGKEITGRFAARNTEQPFTAAPGASATASWPITVPDDVDVVSVRIVATGVGISDGEERPLPVLTDKVLVTESLPLPITKAGTKTFTLEKLVNLPTAQAGTTSNTLQHRSLKLEFTPNPAWYAVQALPYLMEYPHACAEQTFSRYYANRLATHIVEQRPAVRQVFEQWGKQGEAAFLSALEKNQELKSVVLEETPWVLNAQDEGERKRRVALFFDMQRMAAEEQSALKKLRDMQLPNGAWPWWSGMHESRYITQHIIAGFGHLEALKAADTRGDGPNETMLARAVAWLDGEVDRSHRELVKRTKPEDRAKHVPDATDVHLLYARSFFRRWPIDGTTRTAVDFIAARCKETWVQRSLQEQALLALAFDRLGDKSTAQLILKSLSERATRSEELGMYWKGFNAGYGWNDFPTETHALLIEAYHEVGQDKASVDQLRQYLLKLKQTTDWKTTKATSEACYALLLTGDDWLTTDPAPLIKVGDSTIKPDRTEAGTGYMEQTWAEGAIKPEMGRVTVTSTKDGVQWGALHWQYLERMDKVTPHESPFSVKKQVLLKQATDAGARLVEADAKSPLEPGDRVVVRIELRTDRHLDFVHLKDQRAAAFEPVEAISGYTWQGGLGYYQSIRDAGMHFFFDHIAPGTYVFEYELKVTHAGAMSNGITTAMCMYAPEFAAHSEGVRVVVADR